ncbi:WbqC family protein [Ulvibacter antarcticus]|uniref:WbqC-like protein n=1 Tax=Ulvibacter antarcticus TaxID=442714 RepID=A0A3L9YB59_9FLAO|nr:WbqC family protein [Ulvibacter antarcticus]RMA57966.1 WbqC-like protein [Ulvibacter antarcticus]
MKLAIMQPYFFPYVGYFQLLQAVDTFIFYDDVNFIKKGWINRNNILINNEAFLFSVPCKNASQNKLINEIQINFDINEKNRFLKRIELAYKKAPYFDEFYPLLHDFIMEENSKYISSLAANSVRFISEYLGMQKSFAYSSEIHSDSRGLEKQERLRVIAKKEKADTYINASGGRPLYTKDNFKQDDIKLKFLIGDNIKYHQYDSSFVPWLSIIDILMFNNISQTNNFLHQYSLE